MIGKILLVLATMAALAFPLASPALAATAAPARCSQSIRTTHNSTATTVTIIVRYCNRSYRAWADFADGNHKGPWRTSGQSTVFSTSGGNQIGGYQYEPTGGGTITTHESY